MPLTLVIGVLLARYLGPDRFGTLNFALSTVALVQPLSALGLSGIVTKELVREPDSKDEILGTSFFLKLGASCLSLGLMGCLIWLIKTDVPGLRIYIILLSVGNILGAFQVIDLWFQAKVLSKYVVISRTIALVITSIIKVALIYFKAPLEFFVLSVIIENIFYSTFLIASYRKFSNSISNWFFLKERAFKLLSRSWPLILSGFGSIIYLKIDQIMLGNMISNSELGIYAVASRMSEVWYFIPIAIASSAFPALIKSKETSIKSYKIKLQKLLDSLLCFALIMAIPITLCSEFIIVRIYGDVYEKAATILSIHIWASVFIFMRAVLSKWLIAEDLLIFSLVTHGLGAVSNIIINIFMIPKWGGVGAAVSTVISYAFASYISLFFHAKTLEMAVMMSKSIFSPVRFLCYFPLKFIKA